MGFVEEAARLQRVIQAFQRVIEPALLLFLRLRFAQGRQFGQKVGQHAARAQHGDGEFTARPIGRSVRGRGAHHVGADGEDAARGRHAHHRHIRIAIHGSHGELRRRAERVDEFDDLVGRTKQNRRCEIGHRQHGGTGRATGRIGDQRRYLILPQSQPRQERDLGARRPETHARHKIGFLRDAVHQPPHRECLAAHVRHAHDERLAVAAIHHGRTRATDRRRRGRIKGVGRMPTPVVLNRNINRVHVHRAGQHGEPDHALQILPLRVNISAQCARALPQPAAVHGTEGRFGGAVFEQLDADGIARQQQVALEADQHFADFLAGVAGQVRTLLEQTAEIHGHGFALEQMHGCRADQRKSHDQHHGENLAAAPQRKSVLSHQ